jgi:hypothetical protein
MSEISNKCLVEHGRKHVIGISGGGSSRRPRSIKDCRARGRRRSLVQHIFSGLQN